MKVSDQERLRRWRLILGGEADDGTEAGSGLLSGDDVRIDAALAAVYDSAPSSTGRSGRSGSLHRSAPSVARWLGDIRRYFPAPVVQVLQRDAIERLNLRQLLLEPEMLRAVEPDLKLAALIVELNRLLPDATRETARQVVRTVVADLEQHLGAHTRQAIVGALVRSQRSRRVRQTADIDWSTTIRSNLRNYVPDRELLVPEQIAGFGRRQRSLSRDVIVAIDQSGSMADSVVYAAVFGAVLSSLPTLRTSIVAFDTAVADLSPHAADPVDVLFGVQLGGGTDIGAALGYCQSLVTSPTQTVLVLISDLFEGGSSAVLHERVAALTRVGVTVVVLLALNDDGAPSYDHSQAMAFAELGVASFACTPYRFGELMAAALEGRELGRWANEHGLHTAAPVR